MPISMDVRARPVQHCCRPPALSPFGSSQLQCLSLLLFSPPEVDDPAAEQPQSTSHEGKLFDTHARTGLQQTPCVCMFWISTLLH